MSTTPHHAAARRTEPRANTPTLEGERQASRVRLAMGAVGSALVFAAIVANPGDTAAGLGPMAVVIAWLSISALTLHLVHVGAYKPWLSYLSGGADVALSCAMPFTLMASLNHNFTSGVLAALFFLDITLAALRRGPALVVVVAIASALAYVLITGLLFAGSVPSGTHYLVVDGSVVTGINFTDQMARAISMVVVGWLVAYVARSLRNSERHYHELFEAIPDGIVITRPNGTIATVNRTFAAMSGAAPSSLVGTKLDALLESIPGAGERRSTSLVEPRLALRRAGGSSSPVRIASTPIALAEGTGTVLSVRDVAEHSRLERELARNRSIDTIGRLAGGLAHDFNNILGGILGAASIATRVSERLAPPHREKLVKHFQAIENGGRDAREVVRKLLDFTRTSAAEPRRLSLARVLSDVATLCRKTFGDTIELRLDCAAEGEPTVWGDESALKQALLSVCLNAGDSTPLGGRIALGLEDAPTTRSFYASHPDATPGRSYLCATVADDCSIGDPATAAVHELARRHDGFVEVSAKGGEGVLFRLYLPRSDAAEVAPAARAAEERAS
ncbi:MAG: PAS domain S-box protein [Proteobacteria bacterium]|jgi:PAS domain S-box-containing protein|nr:PAS domain S-box protein [Pseudomonadota bacterium]